MKKTYFIFLFLFLATFAKAQTNYCGNVEPDSALFVQMPYYGNNAYLSRLTDSLQQIRGNQVLYQKGLIEPIGGLTSTIFQIPVTAWVYGNGTDNGIDDAKVQRYINRINQYFKSNDVRIFLYLRPVIERRANTTFYSGISTQVQGINMISTNRVDNTLNIHFIHTSTFSRSGSVNPWEGYGYSCYVATSGNYDEQSANFLIHEIGHTLGLLHTHRSRSTPNGGAALGNNALDGNCWQEAVSRSKTQGLLCNNRGKLKCELNGDGLCDTDADPNLMNLVGNHRVSADCNSYVPMSNDNNKYKKDNWGDNWLPVGNNNALSNIMSHSRWGCRTAFTPLQKGIMYR